MRNLSKIVTGVLLLFILFTAPSTAEITSVKIRSRSDNRDTIFFEKFGFKQTGHVSVAISSVSVTAVPVSSKLSPPDPSRIGFFLVSEEALTELRKERKTCDLDSKFITLLFTFEELSPQSSFNKSLGVTFPGDYWLFFANCNPSSYVTMDVLTEFYNTDNDTTTKDYLSAGLTQLPSLYFKFSLVYLCFLGFWIAVCLKNKLSFNRSHLLMGVLLVIKGLSLFCAAKNLYHVKATGNLLYGWDVMFYIFQFIQGVVLYIVMSVISDGWYLLKPYSEKKKLNRVLMVVILVQVLATVASIVGGESGPFTKGWMTWNMVLLAVQATSCYVIIVPLAVLIWSLVRETRETDHDVEAAKKYLLRFLIVVIGYLFIELLCLSCGEGWVTIASVEITSLVFYMVMFCMFRPFETNKYFQLSAMEEDFVIVDIECE